jgi:hypothetical protein
MRRIALTLTLGCCALLLLCGGAVVANANHTQVFVYPGARDVQIIKRGPAQVSISYVLPAGHSINDLSQALEDQGWQLSRMRRNNQASITVVLVRHSWFGALREVVQINVRTDNRRIADLLVGRCIKIEQWAHCV